METDIEKGYDNLGQEAPSVLKLLMRHKKRTLDLFLGNYGHSIPEDHMSLRAKLSSKIHDEFEAVKDLPPPKAPGSLSIPTATKSSSANHDKPNAVSKDHISRNSEQSITEPLLSTTKRFLPPPPPPLPSSTSSVEDHIKILPPHKFPSRPGIEEDISSMEKEEEITDVNAYEQVMQSLPKSKSQEDTLKTAHSIVSITERAGLDERIRPMSNQTPPSKALSLRGTTLTKPQWHPPWKLMRVISGHLGWVRAICVDSSNEWFVTGGADRTIKIWDLASGQLKLTLTGHISTIRGLQVSSRHPYMFSVGEDKTVKCWDLEQNKVVRQYHGHLSGVYCCYLHPTLDVLATGGRDATVRIWDIRTKAQVHVLTGHNSTVDSVLCQSTDPQVISGSADSTIRLWDLAKGETSVILTHHKKSVRALALHPEEYTMGSASADNIKAWKFPEGRFLKNFSGHHAIINALAVNRDNILVSGADNGSLYFWDWTSSYNFQKLHTVVQPGSLESEAGIFAMTFDQSGSRLLTCEADKTIKVFKEDDTATEESHPIDVDWRQQIKQRRW